MNILLDYFFPITSITPTPQASTAFLKQVCVVGKPKDGGVTAGEISLITTAQAASDYFGTDAANEVQQLFNAGMNRVYVLPMEDLDLADALEGHESDFFTVLISSDFTKEEITHVDAVAAVKASKKIQDITYEAVNAGAGGNNITITYIEDQASGDEAIVSVEGSAITVDIDAAATSAETIADEINEDDDANDLVVATVDDGDEDDIQNTQSQTALEGGVTAVVGTEDGLQVGEFKGVIGVSDADDAFLAAQAAIENRAAFHTTAGNKAKNMFYAFGKLLSNSLNWLNQQYVTMPFADDVDTLGEANALFDDKISFVISDSEFGHRLALFAQGAKAITAPYIKRNLEIDLQSKALQYISGNQPPYSKRAAALLEDELKTVVDSYITRQWIENGTVEVKLEQSNFTASGYMNISEPNAMWRIFGEIRQTL